MKKIFLFLFAALMSVSMFAAQTVVTINPSDLHNGTTCKKGGVTMTAAAIDDVDAYITGPISFSTELGKFIKIEIQAIGAYVEGEGWTGDNYKKTWTGKASTVASTGNISTLGHITFTIEIPYAGEGTEESPYLISSAEEWNTLADKVNGGTTYSGVYFQLTDDIEISTMVGLSDHNFNGIFDGAGHTITATLSSDAACCAPFAYTYGATIKNLHVTGTLTTSADHAGGVVGRNGSASLTLTNISCDMTINSTASNGGLVGYTINATLSGCAFTGKLLSETSRRIGGFVGWKSNTDGSYLTITDCLFAPAEVTNGASNSKTFAVYGGGTVTITNCYYTESIGSAQGKPALSITGGSGVTVENAGEPTEYTVSGITGYGVGILYNSVLYGGWEDSIILYLSGYSAYSASAGTLSDNGDGTYTLSMLNTSVVISGNSGPTGVEEVTGDRLQVTEKYLRNGILFINKDGKTYNAQGAVVK